jgi:hypothetical protein
MGEISQLSSEAIFREPKTGEVRRIYLLGRWVNSARQEKRTGVCAVTGLALGSPGPSVLAATELRGACDRIRLAPRGTAGS